MHRLMHCDFLGSVELQEIHMDALHPFNSKYVTLTMRWGFFTKFDALAHGVPCLLSHYKPVLILSTSCSTQPPVKQFFIGQITTGMRIKVKTLTLVQYCTKMHFSKFCPMTIFENITCSQRLNLQFLVVYDLCMTKTTILV